MAKIGGGKGPDSPADAKVECPTCYGIGRLNDDPLDRCMRCGGTGRCTLTQASRYIIPARNFRSNSAP